MSAFGFTNLAATATIAASTTFAEAGWPAANVQLFGHPHIRAHSADLNPQRFTLDFGVATVLTAIALINPNFLTVTIQGHTADAWGTPDYTSGALTMGYAANGRVHHIHRPTAAAPFNKRYLSLSIPNQATTDGATQFRLGPVFACALVIPPRGVRVGHVGTKVAARLDPKTEDGRPLGRLVLDDPAYVCRTRFQAADDAELATWRSLGRQWDAAEGEAALIHFVDTQLSDVYLMRRDDDEEWPDDAVWSETTMVLREVTAG